MRKIWFTRIGVLSILCLYPAIILAQGFRAEDAVARMQVTDGLRVRVVLSEPDVRQPNTMSFDDRGRLWVIQYLQYPNPAGLKPVKVDQYLRTVYDRVPEPPPRGPKGADRITIYEYSARDGRYHYVRDFVTGLNLASGMALGHGGVWVAQPPYLLFYPDRNGDDIPDSDPEVHLSGFGMHDAHAFANSLQWGPDGWLYGAQGSTVTANIRGVTFQQGIWRYHPLTREFELFAEGGGNTYGLDFDRRGNVIAGTNYGNAVMLHQVQGAYYIKGFAKHGELQNPFAFGYFDHVPYKGFKGGHVTCGGVLYYGGAFPQRFDGCYIAANPLANSIYWHTTSPKGSTFNSQYGGDFLLGNDTWFRPVDMLVGPDGALYIADWYDKRLNHVDPVDNWDRTNGRIYKVESRDAPAWRPINLSRLTSHELVAQLGNANYWYVREARRILAERRDQAVVPELKRILFEEDNRQSLEALWALAVSGGFTDELALRILGHRDPAIRSWTVRLLGDARKVTPAVHEKLLALAQSEREPIVRSQLASTCKRLPGDQGLPIVAALWLRAEDADDPFIPLLVWWAVEDKASSERERVLRMLEDRSVWRRPLVRNFIVERLSRRYMAAGSELDHVASARLLAMAPEKSDRELVLTGLEKALAGRRIQSVHPLLRQELAALWPEHENSLTLIRLGLRLGDRRAYTRALEIIADRRKPQADRTGLIEVVGQLGTEECIGPFLNLLQGSDSNPIKLAVLGALQPLGNAKISEAVLGLYPRMPGELRGRAQTLLCGRLPTTKAFLKAVDRGHIDPKEVSFDQLRRILLHNDNEIRTLVKKHWGQIGQETTGEKRARIGSIRHMMGTGAGSPQRGHKLFIDKCATCHALFGEGSKIGPELTTADRKNSEFLISSIVDPSAVVRNEYQAYVVVTTNGRLLNGLIVDAAPATITLVDAKNERTTLARDLIEEIKPSTQSLMPEKILDDLDEQQIRDLLSYLQSSGLPAASTGPGQKKTGNK